MAQIELTINGQRFVLPYFHKKEPIIDDSLSQPDVKFFFTIFNNRTDDVYLAGSYEAVTRITGVPKKWLLESDIITDWEWQWDIYKRNFLYPNPN